MKLKTSEKHIIILAFGELLSKAKRKIKGIENKGVDSVHEAQSINQIHRWIATLNDLENKLINEQN
tara:strand:- start:1685 stop:1882 length:198 start_codon:yes stop_codon:yes gene_type:complete